MNEIVTCSLDKTIKTWDIHADESMSSPISTIHAKYPVWRARYIPFGRGLLTLPQRGSTELEMWKNEAVVERFTGHSDVVKEFVWRRGSGECRSTGFL
jgi:WD40 repeat protein